MLNASKCVWFQKSLNRKTLSEQGVDLPEFVQDNHSMSAQTGTIRGLHFQSPPHAQGKLVRCGRGALFDVAVDIRKGSPTYGKWVGEELSFDNGKQLWILAVAAGIAYAPTLCEAVYGHIEGLRHADYVLANRAYGLTERRILWGHLVWAASRRLVLRHLLALFAYFLVLETTLSYLGDFGVLQPEPSWGNMLAFDWGHADAHGVTALAPALAIWVVVAAVGQVQDALPEGRDG